MKTILTLDGSQVYHGRFVSADGDNITVEVTHIYDMTNKRWEAFHNVNGAQRVGTWAATLFGAPQVVAFGR